MGASVDSWKAGCFGLLFFFPFLGASVVFAGCTFAQLRATHEIIAIPTTLEGLDGPRILHGRAFNDAGLVSPGGLPAAMWTAEITIPAGRRSRHTICEVQEAKGLSLDADGIILPLAALLTSHVEPDDPRASHVSTTQGERNLAARVDPKSALRAYGCPPIGTAPAPPMSYDESTIAAGTPLTVRACVAGGTIVPCGDGHDQVTTGGTFALRAAVGYEESTVAFGQMWNTILWSMVAAVLGAWSSRSEPTKKVRS